MREAFSYFIFERELSGEEMWIELCSLCQNDYKKDYFLWMLFQTKFYTKCNKVLKKYTRLTVRWGNLKNPLIFCPTN